ncbi:hypothetical protein LJE71_20630 [Xanthobacter autotrophicus]|uniref:Uncharacterized protein n=1 Tax=Xanthobacter dioxanivorans TaxID=2528964 RepID=A0A974PUR4_9HYPH|nr:MULTISPECIES: hypothetical protein [Xanthobacter]QRG10139.1 hypothetical protein EZH22_30105 [Xanthobacter dioxanivorans]UDQ88619.1 hypothetical protein LJE71_20630 [Xanthobacter autotrophicus]
MSRTPAEVVQLMLSAMSEMATQIEQMQSMFTDEDGAIANALDEYADAEMAGRELIKALTAS